MADDSFKSDFLMRLFFATNLSDHEIVTLIEDEIARKEQKIAQLEKNYEIWKEQGISKNQELTLRY
ncbi:PadR family transcriptional regulator, partial [Streptococcus suis]